MKIVKQTYYPLQKENKIFGFNSFKCTIKGDWQGLLLAFFLKDHRHILWFDKNLSFASKYIELKI